MTLSNGMKKTGIKKILIFFGVTALCTGLVFILYSQKPQEQVSQRETIPLRPVTVASIKAETRGARIKAFGEAFPRWEARLRSQVSGAVVQVNENLQPGREFSAGDLLLQVEDAAYVSALADAKRDLADARVNLLQTQRRAHQARRDWKRSGLEGEPQSPLVLYAPQIRAARAREDAARAAVAKAQRDLDHTRIRAPFGGQVVERSVGRGDVLFAGDDLARLVSLDEMEIRVKLEGGQAGALTLGDPVEILDARTGRSWTGTLVRRGGKLDAKTRLRTVYIRPDQAGILPGMFVTVFLRGGRVSNLLGVPESALTRDGYIWHVDSKDRLVSMAARVAFYQGGKAFVENVSGANSLRVVLMPVQSFYAGVRVSPRMAEHLVQDGRALDHEKGSQG